jgi:hypothetical protein
MQVGNFLFGDSVRESGEFIPGIQCTLLILLFRFYYWDHLTLTELTIESSPGRWHADLVLKLALSRLLSVYDFRLEKPETQHRWWWETFQLPYENTRVLFRRRKKPIVPVGDNC